ncbi:unnamed protein product, partial [marine sediment metagenome]
EVLGAENVNNALETEFEKEVMHVDIKRALVPTIDDVALGAKQLFEKSKCDFAVLGYSLDEGEKLSTAFQNSVLTTQFHYGKHIFRVIVPGEESMESYVRAAAKEIVRYHFKPEELQDELTKSREEGEESESSFNPFAAMFG